MNKLDDESKRQLTKVGIGAAMGCGTASVVVGTIAAGIIVGSVFGLLWGIGVFLICAGAAVGAGIALID